MNNAFLRDERLSLQAKGLLAVILTNKEDWRVYPEEIAKRTGIGKRSVERHFKALEEAGYMFWMRTTLGRGKGSDVERFFSDVPLSKNTWQLLV